MNINIRPEYEAVLFQHVMQTPAGCACTWHYSWNWQPRCVAGASLIFRSTNGMLARAVVESILPPEHKRRRKVAGWRIVFTPETFQDMRTTQYENAAAATVGGAA